MQEIILRNFSQLSNEVANGSEHSKLIKSNQKPNMLFEEFVDEM